MSSIEFNNKDEEDSHKTDSTCSNMTDSPTEMAKEQVDNEDDI